MTTLDREIEFAANSELARMIEPLASYICATDQPRAALASAVAALLSQVDQTNRAAIAHFGAFAGGR